MTDDEPGPAGPAASRSNEVERLRAERDRLAADVARLEARPSRRRRARRVAAPILTALAVVVFTMTVPGAWGRRTVLNTDRYVATVAPLASDPAVQEALARRLTQQVFSVLRVEDVVADALPERAAFLAAPLTSAVQDFVQDKVVKLLQTDAFRTFWVQANRFVHTQVLAILDGESETVSVRGGKVVLNLLPLVNLALAQIRTAAPDFVGAEVTIPEIEITEVPSAAVQRLEQALGVDLPSDYGSLVVYDADELEALQRAVRAFDRLIVLLAVLILVLTTLAMSVSVRRRRTLIQLASGAAAGLVLVRRVSLLSRDQVLDAVKQENRAAVRAISDQLMHSLLRYTGVLLAIVLAVLLVALVTGPYPWAVKLRTWVADVVRATVVAVRRPGEAESGALRWVAAHRDAVMLGGAALALVLMFVVDLGVVSFWVIAIALAVFEFVVWRAGGAYGGETRTP